MGINPVCVAEDRSQRTEDRRIRCSASGYEHFLNRPNLLQLLFSFEGLSDPVWGVCSPPLPFTVLRVGKGFLIFICG